MKIMTTLCDWSVLQPCLLLLQCFINVDSMQPTPWASSQTNIRGNIQYAKQPIYQTMHTFWTGEVPGGLHSLHSSWETVNSLAGGIRSIFITADRRRRHAGKLTHRLRHQRDRQTDRGTADQVDRQAGGHRCKQTAAQKSSERGNKALCWKVPSASGENIRACSSSSSSSVFILIVKQLNIFEILLHFVGLVLWCRWVKGDCKQTPLKSIKMLLE